MAKTIFQLFDQTWNLIIVFLILSGFLQSFQNKLRGCFVFKLTLFQVFLELVEQFIRQNKFRRSRDRGMSCRVFVNKIKDHILQHQFLGYFSVLFRLDFHVRRDATTVIHDSPGLRFKGFHQRIGNRAHATIRVTMRIIHRLNTASTRNIIFRRGHF